MQLLCGKLRRLVTIVGAKARASKSNFCDTLAHISRYVRPKPASRDLMNAIAFATMIMRRRFGSKLHPFHFKDSVKYLLEHSNSLDTSCGMEFRKRGYKTKLDVLTDISAVNKIHSMLHAIKSESSGFYNPTIYACVMKAKEIDSKIKYRFAFVMPIQVLIAETMFAAPFLSRLPENWVPKPETHHSYFCGKYSKSFDFSKFDSSVPSWVIRAAFIVLRSCLDLTQYEHYGKPTGINTLLKWVEHVYTNKKVVTPQITKPLYLKHGVPSGGMLTNIIDTIISYIVMYELHNSDCPSRLIIQGPFPSLTVAYGDDCHTRCCTCVDDDLVMRAKKLFGMDLKIEHPNELCCLTYCKAECINGVTFHSGQWFRDIIDCAPIEIRKEVCECLLHALPTRSQKAELLAIREMSPEVPLIRKFRDKFLLRMKEFLGINHHCTHSSLENG